MTVLVAPSLYGLTNWRQPCCPRCSRHLYPPDLSTWTSSVVDACRRA